MDNKTEQLILESLFVILSSITAIREIGTYLDFTDPIKQQKSKINDRLVELQKGRT